MNEGKQRRVVLSHNNTETVRVGCYVWYSGLCSRAQAFGTRQLCFGVRHSAAQFTRGHDRRCDRLMERELWKRKLEIERRLQLHSDQTCLCLLLYQLLYIWWFYFHVGLCGNHACVYGGAWCKTLIYQKVKILDNYVTYVCVISLAKGAFFYLD